MDGSMDGSMDGRKNGGWMDGDRPNSLSDFRAELALFPFLVEHGVWDLEGPIPNKGRS